MPDFIDVTSQEDARAIVLKNKLKKSGFSGVESVLISDIYALDMNISPQDLKNVKKMLVNDVFETGTINNPQVPENFDWMIQVGYLPGVTDNVSTTVREGIEDLLKKKFPDEERAYTSKRIFLKGKISDEEIKQIAESLANPIIQSLSIMSYKHYLVQQNIETKIPRVSLEQKIDVSTVKILEASDEELTILGKKGIPNEDGTTRGPLAMGLPYMKTIQDYFLKKGRNPSDLELESIAQTWSEHCKHTIFADPIDDINEGLFRTHIKKATNFIRARKAMQGNYFSVSVFSDNAGGIVFDENYIFAIKAETHNSPSALDPFGGSITGIVGVNRDIMGFGMGAKPVVNLYGFCFADPEDKSPIYKGENFTQKMLPPEQIMLGVIEGVNVGGNTSGIPTPQGFMIFDEGYKGKPLVFVGTGGIIKRELAGKHSHEKRALPGDYIVMVGGRVGKDGIHGATFSSEAMDSGSPATAVQIGDPITQKKMSDALVKEAALKGLYNSITDNGAGGLSCSVAEMAKEAGGFVVNLDKVPLKYPGLQPGEIWISESQERMTVSVSPEKWNDFNNLMKRRGVEATVIGEFTNSGNCEVYHNGKTVMDMEMDFLHNGLPKIPMKTKYDKLKREEPKIEYKNDITQTFLEMLSRKNIASKEFISKQYDHEVQGGSVTKPLQGRGRVNADASVIKPVLESNKAVVLSQGIHPFYSEIDTYEMAAAAIDAAIRKNVVTGGNLEHMALMDNFCWCSSNDPERLGQLKAATQACYDISIAYMTPFISGKDSMFNDFKGFDENGNPTKISILPTLMVTAVSVMEDATKAVTLDAKMPFDKVYVIGRTKNELGGSEYFAKIGEDMTGKKYIGNTVPVTYPEQNIFAYKALSNAISKGLVSSAQSVDEGGLAIALAKMSMGGKLGMSIDLNELPGVKIREDYLLFSQSTGRIVVTVNPEKTKEFEDELTNAGLQINQTFRNIGFIRDDNQFIVESKRLKNTDADVPVINTTVEKMLECYKQTFKGY